MSHTVTWPKTTPVTRPVTLRDVADVLTRLADDIDSWIPLGAKPPIPEDLALAAERITAAMKLLRPTPPAQQMPVSQLVISLAIPGEDVTAKDLCDRLTGCGWTTTNQAISVALRRAALRGIFERPRRGVYRLATPESHSELAKPDREEERSHANALATLEREDPI